MEAMKLLVLLLLFINCSGTSLVPTNLESPCGEEGFIFVESSFPVPGVTECQKLCQASDSCEFFSYNSGKCGIRSYSPGAIVNASLLQEIGTQTVFDPIFNGKVFVGKALEISGGNSLDCQRSCQSNYYCLSWTWNTLGELCVHNYGRTERKLPVRGPKVVSGPKYCKPELKYQRCTVSLGETCEEKEVQSRRPVSCDEITVAQFASSNAIATIYPLGVAKSVLCDAITDVENCISGKGPWTVFVRRGQYGNPKDYFSSKLWDDYVNGFGDPSGEIWLGLKNLATITSTGRWELRVDFEDYDGKEYFALYSNFRINFDGPFTLSVSGYDQKSTLRDSLSFSNGAPFSTSDSDNDASMNGHNCAIMYKGAWWYKNCHRACLNGLNHVSGDLAETSATRMNGIFWYNANKVPKQDWFFSWPKAEMKIRKTE